MILDLYHVIGEPTSATMTALIGDLCTTNHECSIEHSHCVGGVCVCRDTYAESADRLSCSGRNVRVLSSPVSTKSDHSFQEVSIWGLKSAGRVVKKTLTVNKECKINYSRDKEETTNSILVYIEPQPC